MIEERFYLGEGLKEAPSIVDPLIVTASMARVRAQRFLEDPNQGAYYNVKERTLAIPYRSTAILPGTWVKVYDSRLGLNGKLLRVASVSVLIERDGLTSNIVCQEFIAP
jgi:hypothetical protein